MIRLYVVVEGATEERFCQRVLAPALSARQVYLYPMQVRRGGGARGGGRSWQPWARHLGLLMRQHGTADVRFSTLLDLYGVPRDTPGFDPALRGPALARALCDGVRRTMPDPRFIPYFQLHEFEALVFASLDQLGLIGVGMTTKAALQAEAAEFETPEHINQGYATAPSRRIARHVPHYDKVAHGTDLTEAAGLTHLRDRCRGFDRWVTMLGG